MKKLIALMAVFALLVPALRLRAAASAEESPAEPEGYVWLRRTEEVTPGITFSLKGDQIPTSGVITLKATVCFDNDIDIVDGDFGIAYVNCYSYADAEKAGHFDYLINFCDFAVSNASVQLAGYSVPVLGDWVDFTYDFDIGAASYARSRETSKVQSSEGRAKCDLLQISVGFYNVSGTVKVARISAECEGNVFWEADLTHGLDPDDPDPSLGNAGFSGMEEENRGETWGVVTGPGKPAEPAILRGDFDGDGELLIADAVYLLRRALFPRPSGLNQDGDVNRDGRVDGDDAVLTARCVLEPDEHFELREPTLVSKGKRYTARSELFRTDVFGDTEDEKGVRLRYKLTDGRVADRADSSRIAAYGGGVAVTIDLISSCLLTDIRLDLFGGEPDSADIRKTSAVFSVSENGVDFTPLGGAVVTYDSEKCRGTISLDASRVSARFIKAEIAAESGVIRTSELAVRGYELRAELNATDIARVYIETEGARIRKSEYIPCAIKIVDPTGTFADIEDDSATVKVRGNSTSGGAKKPYNIRFEHKQKVLGMGDAKKWYLIANMYDKTQIRNKLAFDLADDIGMAYVQQSRFVDLYVNGEYTGIYLLCESIGVGESRVDIDVTGNEFLLEYEPWPQYANAEWITTPVYGMTLGFNEPDVPSEPQREYLRAFLLGMESAIESRNYDEIAKYIDIDSFVDAFIVQEFFKQVDYGTSSTRFYLKDGRLYEGPVWDFDLSAGNASPDYYTGYNNVGGSGLSWQGDHCFGIWNKRLFKCEKIVEKVKERYAELQPYIVNVYKDNELGRNRIDALLEQYGEDIARNYTRWSMFEIYSELEKYPEDGLYESEIAYLRDWFENRNEWMLERYGLK